MLNWYMNSKMGIASIDRRRPSENQDDQGNKLTNRELIEFRKLQERERDQLVKLIQEKPWTYISLRDRYDKGDINLEDATFVLRAWQEIIDENDRVYGESKKNEIERILTREKVPSAQFYPEEYCVVPIGDQYDILKADLLFEEHLPSKNPAYIEGEDSIGLLQGLVRENRLHADGIFYIPPIYLTARIARERNPLETKDRPDDQAALWYVLKRLKEVREERGLPSFVNHFTEVVDHDRYTAPNLFAHPCFDIADLRLHPKAAIAHAKNELFSDRGLTFWAMQTGIARRGESPRYSLLTLKRHLEGPFAYREAPVDLYLMACVFLTHPTRADHRTYDDGSISYNLGIWTPGSTPFSPRNFTDGALDWGWGPETLFLYNRYMPGVYTYRGSASVFVPEMTSILTSS